MFKKLSVDEAGNLIQHFCKYITDENPIPPDRVTELLFIEIQATLKRDLIEWNTKAKTNRQNGALGGRPKKTDNNPKKPNGYFKNPKKGVTVTVTDTVTVLSKDNINSDEKSSVAFSKKIDFVDLIMNKFNESYKNAFRDEFINSTPKKERSAIGKILKLYKDKHPENDSNKTLYDMGVFFDNCMTVKDSWLIQNMSPSLILNKLNTITKLINGNIQSSSKTGVSDDFIINLATSTIPQ